MRRILASARTDFEIELRGGLVLATVVVTAVSVAGLRALPPTGLVRLLPVVALQNLGITAFFFSMALVLLERSENSGTARAATPLRPGEFLAARVATLATLAAVQHASLGAALLGFQPQLVALVAGVVLACAVLVLAGFILAAGKESLGAALVPALLWLAVLLAPMAADVLEWRHPLLLLHPLQGAFVVMRAGVTPTAPVELAVALLAALAWTFAAFVGARRVYWRIAA
jgi:fluoroquinolone transport system permease protein